MADKELQHKLDLAGFEPTFLEQDESGADVAEEAGHRDQAAEDALDPEREVDEDFVAVVGEFGAVQVVDVAEAAVGRQRRVGRHVLRRHRCVRCGRVDHNPGIRK